MAYPLPSKRRLFVSYAVFTGAIYAILMLVELDAAVRAKQEQAFGPELWGVPIVAVCMVVETLLFLPMLLVFWHMLLIAVQALAEGRRFSIGYMITAYRRPHLLRSWWICIAGLAYFVAITGMWIAWTAYKKI
ncbi:hypothetical protein BH11PLA1_BH11PLA1_18160 [soil metagenome]